MKSLSEAKYELLQIIDSLGTSQECQQFMDWIINDLSSEVVMNQKGHENSQKRKRLTEMALFSRSLQSNQEAIASTETIQAPANSTDGLNFQNTAHVDAFLFDESDVEEMTASGKIATHFCRQCGSKNVDEIELITHSCARDDLEFIFDAVLPDLTGKVLLDIGSRIGAVLFGAHIFSSPSNIIGIEMNGELCHIAQKTAQQFQMLDRIQIIHGELSTRLDLVTSADVIVLNNVFDWFAPVDIQVKLWQMLRQHVKSGSLMLTIPSIPESLNRLPNGADINLAQWVTELSPFHPEGQSKTILLEKCENIKLYKVIC
jgi:hypothetical protein